MKTLVTYFSAEAGRTRRLAERMATVTEAEIFEIVPEKIYTKADLKYINPLARCNKEMLGKKDVPVQGYPENFEEYDMVLIGFPVWYSAAPNVINTFCKSLDFTGKKVALFAVSGGGSIGKSLQKLSPYVKGAEILDARLFNSASDEELKAWAESL